MIAYGALICSDLTLRVQGQCHSIRYWMRPCILGGQVCEIQSWNSLKFRDKSGVQNNGRVLEENALLVL